LNATKLSAAAFKISSTPRRIPTAFFRVITVNKPRPKRTAATLK
jgi:hypothetical protein